MPTVACPVLGFEHLSVTFPDEWLMEHRDKFHKGYLKASNEASPATRQLFGTLELCKIESTNGQQPPDVSHYEKLPLKWVRFFTWLDDTVFDSYAAEFQPDPNS
jgi:hypothetical protein